MIYYPHRLQPAAIRFKNSLQKNTKIHAISEDIIEACHNGIVSWGKHSNVIPIGIRGKDDYVKTKERWEIVKKYFEENNIDYRVESIGGNILSKIINLIHYLDYVSIYHALLNDIDPSPVESINFIKNKL
jgi:glucose/mannose-6-phosphate isomerase